MAYRETKIGALARRDPDRAAERLLLGYARCRCSLNRLAAEMGVSRRTLDRIARSVGVVSELREVKRRRRESGEQDVDRGKAG